MCTPAQMDLGIHTASEGSSGLTMQHVQHPPHQATLAAVRHPATVYVVQLPNAVLQHATCTLPWQIMECQMQPTSPAGAPGEVCAAHACVCRLLDTSSRCARHAELQLQSSPSYTCVCSKFDSCLPWVQIPEHYDDGNPGRSLMCAQQARPGSGGRPSFTNVSTTL
jgi:hypothetical protein